jgi:hypothetical protein
MLAVDVAAELDALRSLADVEPSDDLQPLTTPEAVIGYFVAYARAEGLDEADLAELLVRGAGMSPAAVRASERTLRRLGYGLVSDRLREIAGRRKHDLRPL